MRRLLASVALLLLAAPAFAWDARDAKPVEELMLMDEQQLTFQAALACSARVTHNIMTAEGHGALSMAKGTAALNYFSRIGLVARKNNGGNYPAWYGEMSTALQGIRMETCHEISLKRYEEHLKHRHSGSQQSPASTTSADTDVQMRNLNREFQAGKITADEYQRQRKLLIGE